MSGPRSLEDRSKPRLFYGVNSEGMGHAMRCLPVIERLRARYDVHVFCGGRVKSWLEDRLPNVWDLFFIPLLYRDNRMLAAESTRAAFARAPACFADAGWLLQKMIRERPVAVLTDYEFLTTWIGFFSRRKIIAIDNNHMPLYGALPPPSSPEQAHAKATVLTATKWNVPFADVTLLSSFWQPGLGAGVDPSKVRYAACAVRDEVLARRTCRRDDGPVLVYQTSSTNHRLPEVLRAAVALSAASGRPLSFRVYGSGCAPHRELEGRLEFCAFNSAGFLDDLTRCRFVVVNGGHTTIVEALALGKPVLCEPVLGHYEQSVNALGVQALGVGRGTDLLEPADLLAFDVDAPGFRAAAAAVNVVDNDGLVAAIEAAISGS